jgi:hypothetical protein
LAFDPNFRILDRSASALKQHLSTAPESVLFSSAVDLSEGEDIPEPTHLVAETGVQLWPASKAPVRTANQYGAEAWRDPLAITPVFEDIAPELLAFVADNIFWRRAGVDDRVFEEGLNR